MPAGAEKPNQFVDVTPGKPSSAKVGTSGRAGVRSASLVASGRIRPPRIFPMAVGTLSISAGICPPITSVIAGAEPR